MNITKVQQEILKQLLANQENVKYHDFGDEHVFVTTNLKVGYVLPTCWLRVNLSGAQISLDLAEKVLDKVQPCNILAPTDFYRHGGVARKYMRADGTDGPYVDQGLLKCFTNPSLYQDDRDTRGIIAVVEEGFVGAAAKDVVGIVMPMRVEETEN